MTIRKLHSLASFPCSLVLAAARRRDALLRARTTLPSLAALGAIAGLSGGCVAVGGARHGAPPTLGRQLIDLKSARDAGAISESEYRTLRTQLIGRGVDPSPGPEQSSTQSEASNHS